ncbi:MAG TPA: glycosyltransferase [Candidatus Acidoferrum sp.]|jgi:cellulose synthase/poly-beta-1,6-N-acetylglucosamine synthase-like glycosyltransferase
MTPLQQSPASISAVVPARNEEDVIAGCVESLVQQKEIAEIVVVNDQSTDRTAEIVRGLAAKYSRLKMIDVAELPAGWVGKNYAVWLGAREAKGDWLLFTDADAVHEKNAVARALEIAREREAALVSFSPEQIMETWYEKALIPYVYCRLAKKFSYEQVNDPANMAAAANGQFLLIRRDAYEAAGGHASIAGEVLEDVALAKKVKGAGYRIWFGSGKGIVRVRMYRSFGAMWGGWKKNLYQLMGGSSEAMTQEMAAALAPVIAALVATTTVWGFTESAIRALATLAVGVLIIYVAYDGELKRGGFPARLAWYGIRGRLLYAGVLGASYRSHVRGKLEWKGRTYPVGTSGASKG